jgi:N-sulfoglucosamine sulfohydrolase
MSAQEHTRRDFLKAAAGAATLATSRSARGALAGGEAGKKPNLVLYVVDDQGSTDAGCYGNPVIRTPGLDALAKGGVRFTNAFCTSASCSASRSVILSGLHNHANGQYGHQHSYHHFISFDRVRSLPVMLAEAGYRTASWGKYHVAPESVYHFQQYIRFPRGARDRSPAGGADACRPFLAEKTDKPFFLYFCTTEPHRPFRRGGSDPVDPKDVIVPPYLPDTPECRQELARYYMSVQRADKGLLRLLRILQDTGHWDDTVILYCSDNGIAFPGAKTNLYDPGMRLPFVMRSPYAERQGVTSSAMVSYTDITPTLLDFAGASPKGYAFHGRSIRPVLGQENPAGWDEVYASHTFHEITMYYPMRVVRTRRHKLIWNIAHGLDYPFASDLWASPTWQAVRKRGDKVYGRRPVAAYLKRPRFELYDLEGDPHEVRNLAGDAKHAALLEQMKRKLKAFQERTKDPWIVKWRYE